MTSLPAAPRIAPLIQSRPKSTALTSALQFGALVLLSLYCALHWATLLRPTASGDLVVLLVVGLATGLAVGRITRWSGFVVPVAALTAVVLAMLGLVLLVCGVPLGLLRPDRWDTLVIAIGNALAELPALRVPYRGSDPWIRIILPAGGGVLLALGATLALLPRPRLFGATVALGVLYGVPVVERTPTHPYLDGVVFAILLGTLLWCDRLREREAPTVVGLALVALLAAALIAPRVDAGSPWVDYEALAERLQGGATTTFTWNHSYAPLTWPRDGVELARVRSRGDLYLKTADLERFDGLTWRQVRPEERRGRGDTDTEFAARHPGWSQTIHVTIKGLKTSQFLSAGTTTYVSRSSKTMREATPGTFETTGKPLRRGDSYDALVYVPKPSTDELREAGTDYPGFVRRQLSVDIPAPPGSLEGALRVNVAPWGGDGLSFARTASGNTFIDPDTALRASAYNPFYELAQQLARGSTDPANYVQRVIARVQRDARYTETPPPPGRVSPLEAFLFRDHAGYCQHFAGATALLLRLGGVPARVVAGFAPGSLDGKEHVVRDLDAHSWVEAYFPQIGWVTFDPTPADSPARSQITDTQRERRTESSEEVQSQVSADQQVDPRAGAAAPVVAAPSDSDSTWLLAIPGAIVALAVVVALLSLLRHRRLARSPDPQVEELRIALRRSGRSPTPDMTLQRLERLLGAGDAGAGYITALRLARYGPGAAPPTARQRGALRRQLRAGLGMGGRIRSWWALPPHPKEVLGALRPRRRRPYIG